MGRSHLEKHSRRPVVLELVVVLSGPLRAVREFANKGGLVTTGDDAGYIYSMYGFGISRELELHEEAGFHPLEVIEHATWNGARLIGMQDRLGKAFMTIVRSIEQSRKVLATDPYKPFNVSPKAKRIVTFLRGRPTAKIKLPVELDGARILALKDGEIFSAYLPNPKGPVFMTLIDKTFGKDVTTRTWDTVAKVAR